MTDEILTLPEVAQLRGDSPAILLVVLSHADGAAPSINGKLLVPALLPSQRLILPEAWLANAHNAAEAP